MATKTVCGVARETIRDPESRGVPSKYHYNISPLTGFNESLCGFLTCRPDLVVMGDLCASAVNLVGTSASVDAALVGQF